MKRRNRVIGAGVLVLAGLAAGAFFSQHRAAAQQAINMEDPVKEVVALHTSSGAFVVLYQSGKWQTFELTEDRAGRFAKPIPARPTVRP
jgi:hypothetical protein